MIFHKFMYLFYTLSYFYLEECCDVESSEYAQGLQSFQMIFNIFNILRERYQIKFDFDDNFFFQLGNAVK